jgi:hypothetical protein
VAFEKHAPGKTLASALELGTGWYPVVSISLFLGGVQAIRVRQRASARGLVST